MQIVKGPNQKLMANSDKLGRVGANRVSPEKDVSSTEDAAQVNPGEIATGYTPPLADAPSGKPVPATNGFGLEIDRTPRFAPPVFEGAVTRDNNANPVLHKAFSALDSTAATGKVKRIDKNSDALADRWRLISGAEDSLHVTYFTWNKDIAGMALLGHMLKRVKDGVSLTAMLDAGGDALGTKGFKGRFRGREYVQELIGVNPDKVRFRIYNPVVMRNFESARSALACNHDKLLIADGKRVSTGGRNATFKYFSSDADKKGKTYSDTDIHVSSPSVGKDAIAAFDAEFNNEGVTSEIGPTTLGMHNSVEHELLGAYLMMEAWMNGPPMSDGLRDQLRGGSQVAIDIVAGKVVDETLAALEEYGHKPSDLTFQQAEVIDRLAHELVTNPDWRGALNHPEPAEFDADIRVLDHSSFAGAGNPTEITQGMGKLIDAAKHSIVIRNPYVVYTEAQVQELEAAGKRGVEITIMTNSPESTDSALTQAFFLKDWPELMARVPNLRVLVATGDQKQHAKTFVIDGEVTGVTTINADLISAKINGEIGVIAHSEDFAADTLDSYTELLADSQHGFIEYKIERHDNGMPVFDNGDPVVAFGPEDHASTKLQMLYNVLTPLADFARNTLPVLSPLRHPKAHTLAN